MNLFNILKGFRSVSTTDTPRTAATSITSADLFDQRVAKINELLADGTMGYLGVKLSWFDLKARFEYIRDPLAVPITQGKFKKLVLGKPSIFDERAFLSHYLNTTPPDPKWEGYRFREIIPYAVPSITPMYRHLEQVFKRTTPDEVIATMATHIVTYLDGLSPEDFKTSLYKEE